MDALAPQARESAAGRYAAACIRDKRIVEGQPLPDLELPDAEGVVRRVSDFIRPGHYTLVEIWASWCMPCRGEIPFVRRAYDRYHRKGFDVLYVSIDSDAGNWKQALGEEKMPWPQLLDTAARVSRRMKPRPCRHLSSSTAKAASAGSTPAADGWTACWRKFTEND